MNEQNVGQVNEQVSNLFTNNSLVNVWTAICLLILAVIVGRLIDKYCRLDKAGRTDFISSFKKGKCLFIYFAAIPLFLIGLLYGEKEITKVAFFVDFIKSVGYSAHLIALSFEFGSISKLMADNRLYATTVIICFIFVILNAGMFLLSLFQRACFKKKVLKKWKKAANKVLLIGNNRHNIQIIRSAQSADVCLILDQMTEEEEKKLYAANVPFINERTDLKRKRAAICPHDLVSEAIEENKIRFSDAKKKPDHTYCMIVNTESDEKNLAVCREICQTLHQYADGLMQTVSDSHLYKEIIVDLFSHVQVHVFGDPQYEALYFEIVNASNGVIRYLNKHTQIAVDFIRKYPLTEFMTEEQINTKAFILKENVNMNVLLIGFGKTNKQIFLTSVANNQFLEAKEENGKTVICGLRPVKYHIFDKEESEKNKNLNHSYYRYRNEFLNDEALKDLMGVSVCKEDREGAFQYPFAYPYNDGILAKDKKTEDYLPLPMLPAEEYYHHLDINDTRFYNTVREILSGGEKNINYVVIAFSSDLENIDLARKITEKRKEWGLNNVYVFVKVRSGVANSDIFSAENQCFMIGDEKNIVYDLENIKCTEIMKMAETRHMVYEDGKVTHKDPIAAKYKWYVGMSQIKRDSNLYAVLSLRSKLHMMGLDYMPENTGKAAISEKEYDEIYGKAQSPYTVNDGFDPAKYILGRCNTMAVQEHYRWNSYMISQGLIPSSLEQIRSEGSQNYDLRRHGNLTTYEGLIEFFKMGNDDVIRYDYEILDCAFSLVHDHRSLKNHASYIITKK